MKSLTHLLAILLIVQISCKDDSNPLPSTDIDEGNDPNFKIITNDDAGLSTFNRKVVVFDIDIYAVRGIADANLLHAANLLAQYLDNDENGTVDDQNVLDAMKSNKAFLVMWKSESDLNIDLPSGREGQDLGNDETHPEWHATKTGAFDAALEEVWHLVTHTGYAKAYPDVFGEMAGTTLTKAMDKARGGQFTSIPNPYPQQAWYTYDDQTCNYDCMATEYIYWATTSLLGAQSNRLEEIRQEWTLNTKAKLESGDPDIYALLTNSNYKLPTVLPDGTYKR